MSIAAELRSHKYLFDLDEGSFAPSFEPLEEDKEEMDSEETNSTPAAKSDRTIPAPPTRTLDSRASIRALSGATKVVPATPEVEMARKYKNQKSIISAWIDDLHHIMVKGQGECVRYLGVEKEGLWECGVATHSRWLV